MIFSKKISFFSLIIIFLAVLSACGKGTQLEDADQYISTIEQMDIPSGVQIIGLGEATHGNVEFQQLKKDVFKALIKNENVHVFILEGDFGGAQQINDFILNGKGTAKEAIDALDYGIYKTEQMIELVEWMHDYNATANENEKVYFYGNDMQRYDYNKKGLLDFYAIVNEEAAKKYTEQLEHVSNDTMRDLTENQLDELDETIDQIIADLQSNETTYVEQTSTESFAFALQYAEVMKQRTQLFMNEEQYTNLRDTYLADNLQWIVDFEAARGHDKVFVSAHNGHIEKTSASFGYKSMGDYLDEVYGDNYFAIGTDFINSEFQALNRGSDERKHYTLKNHDDLVDAFREVEPNIFYVDFDKASDSKELLEIISTEQRMPNIGDDFRYWNKFLKMFYTIKMTPNEAYDGVIIVKEATPTSVMD